MPENVILLMWTVSKVMRKCFKSLTYRLCIVTRSLFNQKRPSYDAKLSHLFLVFQYIQTQNAVYWI